VVQSRPEGQTISRRTATVEDGEDSGE
jgi:hypothetical protein